MKRLILASCLTGCIAANAQPAEKPYAAPTDKENPFDKVLILGEAEARASVLNPPAKAIAGRMYQSFIANIAAEYETSLNLSEVESGLLIRTLAALEEETPSKYRLHFAIDRWFQHNVDAARYEKWRRLDLYPEYQFSSMLVASIPYLKQ